MTAEKNQEKNERLQAGLCADCVHARRLESSRRSVFLLCGRSTYDAKFPKYPRLPVVECPGFESKERKP
jgi:hypothetical protein